MYTLTTEEVDLLTKNPDPKIAAVALKLKESEEKGEFIPRTRLQKELELKKSLEDKLKEIEDNKKKEEEEKAKKNGEFETLLKTRDEELAQNKIQLEEEKKMADNYRAYHRAVIEDVKKQLNDKWNDEFEKLSLDALLKLPGVTAPKVGVDVGNSKSKSDDKEFFTKDEVQKMSKQEVTANLEKINKSMATW
jgi:hypothetical protein